MRIPRRKLEGFVRTIADQCMESLGGRMQRGASFTNYALFGSDDPSAPAMYNKTYAYLDDLESLLYSPVSLRFHVGDADLPNLNQEAKGRAAAARLRAMARRSDTDTMISEAVWWSLTKGKSLIKQMWKRGGFSPELVQPESFGVLRENHDKLDEDMEAFCHTMLITPYQFDRMISDHPDREELRKKAKRYLAKARRPESKAMPVMVGGMYPYKGSDQPPNNLRGIVNWMSAPEPQLAPAVLETLMPLDEVWIWDDARNDWATFQIIGDDMLIMGKYQIMNAYAYNTASAREHESLVGRHPFHDFCPNRTSGYFWGRSEIINVAMLQEAINSRLNGINRMLRKEEDPPTKFVGSSGVNQQALSRFNKPGGYWTDANPNASITRDQVQVSKDMYVTLHEYERMFDEMGGLPPIAKGHGEAGVRSAGHAETLVRMFSPRFKDRALLVERDVEGLGAGMLDLARVHYDKRLMAWVPEGAAGGEALKPNPLIPPPAEGLALVPFLFADLDENASLTIDSHSSSPAFSAEAKALTFDLLKIGAMTAEDVVEHVDVTDPESLISGIQRRRVEQAKAAQAAAQRKIEEAKARHKH